MAERRHSLVSAAAAVLPGRQLTWVGTLPGAEETFFSDALEKLALLEEE